ncbi:hypothetical protein B9Z65_532 [Elsinoe australis]|uniref:Yeast cell wall synthesis Kre9/Knh1-like N-terminal domain-containing protein n=1 Tax=Elsinoe australis TaxID=40998 RepID=A0A2P8AIS8_9PEZI|nr:hypothetical protein B9Z65_532 [Elsinoe australis]
MSDFSTFALFTAGLAVFAPLVAAKDPITVPGGSNPTAGAIYQPSLNAVVPAGGSFSVTWKPTEEGCGKKVDLVLLKGPSANAMAPLEYIAKGLNNNGSYAWSPSTSLEPSPEDYGIELICQETQAYQYTTRFGISNDKYVAGSDDKTSSSSALAGYGSKTESHSGSHSASATATATPTGTGAAPKYPVGTATGGAGYANGTEPQPTGSLTVPSSLRTTTAAATTSAVRTSAASTSASQQTGAAAALQTGASGLLAAAAIAALAL